MSRQRRVRPNGRSSARWLRIGTDVNGLQVAADWDALSSGTLEHPIHVNEKSEIVGSVVWTGTDGTGMRIPNTGHCCRNDLWIPQGLLASHSARTSILRHTSVRACFHTPAWPSSHVARWQLVGSVRRRCQRVLELHGSSYIPRPNDVDNVSPMHAASARQTER